MAAPDDNSIDVPSHDIAILVLPSFMSLVLAKRVGIVVGAVISFFAARWSIEARLMWAAPCLFLVFLRQGNK